MRKMTLLFLFMLLPLALGRSSIAQDAPSAQQATKAQEVAPAPPAHYYHLDFVIEELGADGKPVNSRAYSTTISTQHNSTMSIRAGSRVPIAIGSNEANGKENTQFQYEDVGVNFDARNAHDMDRQLAFDLTATLSGVAKSNDPQVHAPVIRQNSWQATVLIPVGKSTVLFTSDSTDNKGAIRVLVTATPIE